MRRQWTLISLVAASLAVAACSPSSLVGVDAPSGVIDPNSVRDATSAAAFYQQAVGTFTAAYGGRAGLGGNAIVSASGLFTDEFAEALAYENTDDHGGVYGLDQRDGSDKFSLYGYGAYNSVYSNLHSTRNQLLQARQALALYAPKAPSAWYARLVALQGYTYVMFAELFCNGVPLSEVPLEGPSFATRGFTTQELFEKSVALFDSAATMAGDSTELLNLARVGKGRALLGLGRMSEAAAAVHDVPDEFRYNIKYSTAEGSDFANVLGDRPSIFQVIDREGGTAITWSTDPRTAIQVDPRHFDAGLDTGMLVSGKYATNGTAVDVTTAHPSASISLADGLEARLIEAEADLKAGGSNWLIILNHLRATCVGSAPCSPYLGLPAAFGPMADPGTPEARVDSLMKERAMWLYATGHREGDLRRLVRQYGRNRATLWPSGIYNTSAPNGQQWPDTYANQVNGVPYGDDVVFVVPEEEALVNKQYAGCYDRLP